MSSNPWDLNGLKTKDLHIKELLPKIIEEDNKIKQECKEKYGDDWWEHYLKETDPSYGINFQEQSTNQDIYEGHISIILYNPPHARYMEEQYYEKLKRLFGRRWKRYIKHKPNDPKVNDALIKDAIKTGMWKELPKELQEEYHRQAGE